MGTITRFKKLSVGLSLGAMLAIGLAGGASAVNTVTQQVTAGARTASVADATLTAVAYSHSARTNTGSMTLTADDSTGSDLGWNVTILASNFIDGTKSIAASNFSITTANAPAMTAGQAVDATGGPKVPLTGATGTLDVAKKTVQANAGFGKGTYTQALAVSLAIPAQALAGTYVSTLTTTITAAP